VDGHQPEDELTQRQAALQAEAGELRHDLALDSLLAEVGPVRYAGSYVSGLMSWRDLDVMVLGGPAMTPLDVLALQSRVVTLPGVVGFEYHDERGSRSLTGQARDQRYHVPTFVQRKEGLWRVDLTIWLNDDHANVSAWHESLGANITDDQRRAVLRIKDVWHRRPEYPDSVSGMEIYTAVLDDDIRTAQGFGNWLSDHRHQAKA